MGFNSGFKGLKYYDSRWSMIVIWTCSVLSWVLVVTKLHFWSLDKCKIRALLLNFLFFERGLVLKSRWCSFQAIWRMNLNKLERETFRLFDAQKLLLLVWHKGMQNCYQPHSIAWFTGCISYCYVSLNTLRIGAEVPQLVSTFLFLRLEKNL